MNTILFDLLQGLAQLSTMQKIAVSAVPIIFAITVHEAAHGYIARYFGDMTAQEQGRISLNPLQHIDPVGTILIPAITLVVGGILFGWAKPVPVNFSRLRHPKKDMLWVALAGPGSNLVMAILWAFVIKFCLIFQFSFSHALAYMGAVGIMINVVLMVLNLIPLPPLDGGRVAVSLLPNRLAYQYAKVERFGFIILIALLFSGVLSKIMNPFIATLLTIISNVFF